ncbi:MAG: hypothetical protein J6T10_28250 [Methanobrevibacter sp.]|nr:hypothetical protein [Methanobrevibacter sp.]
MSNEIREDVIILLNESRNKINKLIMIYNKFDKDDVYLKTIKELITNELKDIIKESKHHGSN